MEKEFSFDEDMKREDLVDEMVDKEFSNSLDEDEVEYDEYFDDDNCCGNECCCTDECSCGEDCSCGGECSCGEECACGCSLVDEEDFIYCCYEDFLPQIVERGEDYYLDGKVLSCIKDGDRKYIARVEGSSNNVYEVVVYNTDFGVEHYCDCPYDGACKHSYAVLKAISNKEYKTVTLKEEIEYKTADIREVLTKIPAEDIKKYLLEEKTTDFGIIDLDSLEEKFGKYFPKQGYDYYYNNLYNSIVLGDCFDCMVDSYLEEVRKYISNDEFEEAYLIIKSIIEAYNDSKNMDDNYLLERFPAMGMCLRVIFRKADEKLKDSIIIWTLKLKLSLYYNNYYLEDIILSVTEMA